MTTKPARLWLVRHGQTDWNLAGRIQGHQPTPLNALGRQQAERLAEYLAGKPFAAAYASDLPRARQTAEIVARRLGLPVTTTPDLRERCFGPNEGKLAAELHALRPANEGRGDLADARGLPGVEDDASVWTRMTRALLAINQRHPDQNVLVVTHGGPMALLINRVLGIPAGMPRRYSMANGIAAIIAHEGDAWQLLSLADLPLVMEGQPTLDTAHAPRV